jgi:predicted ATPase with chaperone activity
MAARERQRFKKHGEEIRANAQISTRQIRAHCELGTDAERLLERAIEQQGLTARAHDRILKVARTIAVWKVRSPSRSHTSPKPFDTARSTAAIGLRAVE